MAASETWSDPDLCPFCDEKLASPGAGFVAHLDESPDCEARFENWRDRIGDDVRGGWSG
ncbi:MAG: hypothetical protein ABEH90_06505 [Halolamina sp.]